MIIAEEVSVDGPGFYDLTNRVEKAVNRTELLDGLEAPQRLHAVLPVHRPATPFRRAVEPERPRVAQLAVGLHGILRLLQRVHPVLQPPPLEADGQPHLQLLQHLLKERLPVVMLQVLVAMEPRMLNYRRN